MEHLFVYKNAFCNNQAICYHPQIVRFAEVDKNQFTFDIYLFLMTVLLNEGIIYHSYFFLFQFMLSYSKPVESTISLIFYKHDLPSDRYYWGKHQNLR